MNIYKLRRLKIEKDIKIKLYRLLLMLCVQQRYLSLRLLGCLSASFCGKWLFTSNKSVQSAAKKIIFFPPLVSIVYKVV